MGTLIALVKPAQPPSCVKGWTLDRASQSGVCCLTARAPTGLGGFSMMSAKALVPLLIVACLLLTSKAADSDPSESGLVVSGGRRSLLKDQPANTGNNSSNKNNGGSNGNSGNGNSGNTGNGNSGNSGSTGNTGNGNSGNSGSTSSTGNGSTGNTGSTGNGNSGSTGNGNSGNSGTTGNTANTGNGNSGSTGNGNSGNSGNSIGTSGSTGNGNSGDDNSAGNTANTGNGNSGSTGTGNSGSTGTGDTGNGNSGSTGNPGNSGSNSEDSNGSSGNSNGISGSNQGNNGNGNPGKSGSNNEDGNGGNGNSANSNGNAGSNGSNHEDSNGNSGNKGNSGNSGSESEDGNGKDSGNSGVGNSGKGGSDQEDSGDSNGNSSGNGNGKPQPCEGTCACYDPTWYCDTNPKEIPDGVVTKDIKPDSVHCGGGNFYRKEAKGDCSCVSKKQQCVLTDNDDTAKDRGITVGRVLHGTVTVPSQDCLQLAYIQEACTPVGGGSDPIITGFDERKFHFNDVGNFTLLSDAEGYLLEASFVGVGPVDEVPKETSWTSQVRIYNPKGDKITCHLPQILPNTSTIEVSAQAAGVSKATPMTPFHRTSVQFEDMSATAVLSEGLNPVVIGCHVALPKLEVTVYQVSGWEQASQVGSEKWAAPYTWLNFDVKLLKPLALPVTGILGATYPVTPQEQAALDANSETAKIIRANVDTDPVVLRDLEETSSAAGKARRLFSADMFPLAATFKGMQLP